MERSEIMAALDGCPKIVKYYVLALERSLESQRKLTAKAIERLRNGSEWTSVDKGLPKHHFGEASYEVIVRFSWGGVDVAWFNYRTRRWNKTNHETGEKKEVFSVAHWHPMPKLSAEK